MASSLLGRLRQFDAYPKTLEDFRIKTYGGAAITIISGTLILILFLSELNYYLTTEVRPELFVDTSRGERLLINVDVTFPAMPCAYLSIDAMDVAGEQQFDVMHNMAKERLSKEGIPIKDDQEAVQLGDNSEQVVEAISKPANDTKCGSCYGAETDELPCCNSCSDVREAYRKKGWAFNNAEGITQCLHEGWTAKISEQADEGCHISGYFDVSKVAGNFHFAPGKSFQQHNVHVHDIHAFKTKQFNMSHIIHRLSFGTTYPGRKDPLDGHVEILDSQGPVNVMFQYFVKIVPTTYKEYSGKILKTNQFSATKHLKPVNPWSGGSGLPGVFFMYDLSPMMVQITEHRRSFLHFLTGVCAIVGGVFTVAGMIDAFVYHSAKVLKKKIELGKHS